MGIFGNTQDPVKAAMPHLNAIEPQARQGYEPYVQQGQTAGKSNADIYKGMAEDPFEWLNNAFKNYHESEGFKYNEKKLNNQSLATASAGGYVGTPYHQQQQAELINGLMGQDFQNYLSNITGAQNAGLAGQQHQADIGFASNKELQDILASILGLKGELAFKGANAANQNNSDLLKAGIGAIGTIGGAFAGGPAGAAVGHSLGGKLAGSF